MTGTPCGAEFERTPGEYLYCQRGAGHRGKHRLRVTVAEWSDPEPVPEWRRLVDGLADEMTDEDDPGYRETPLQQVLGALSEIAGGKNYLADLLARIVVVCEAQVGDGWQADPSGWVATPNIHALMRNLTEDPREVAFPETNWRGLGNAAVAWLRSLTGDAG